MKLISISPNETLASLSEKVGVENVDQILADNGLSRTPYIGQQWAKKCKEIIETSEEVTPQKKLSILNNLTDNSDIYELAALADENDWKLLAALNSPSGYLYISDIAQNYLSNSYELIGNGIYVDSEIWDAVSTSLMTDETVDYNIFNRSSPIQVPADLTRARSDASAPSLRSWFQMPDSEIMLYSSLTGDSVYIPVYPEELQDSRSAEYMTMPDMLYQYEPWQMYQSSGPRTNTYEFKLHRDMWTGDHSDGLANQLIRFCQAQCYPSYNGSAVVTSKVSLYMSGYCLITGVLTNVEVNWYGPLGREDNWYLFFDLKLTITEVSNEPLNYGSILQKPLIG